MLKPTKNQALVGVAILAVLFTLAVVSLKTGYGNIPSFLHFSFNQNPEAIAKKSVDFLNKNVLAQGQQAELISFAKQSGVVKMKIKIGEATYDSYATMDGKLLFPEAFNLDGTLQQGAKANETGPAVASVTLANVQKVAKTQLDAYVVSYCPFGLQMQRAMSEAVKNIPSLAEFIEVKYIGAVSQDGKTITAMHGEKEAKQNVREICIREEQKAAYWPYIACKIKSESAADACLSSVGVNVATLNGCVADPARGVAFAKKDFALQAKHQVKGSPTLVLNESIVDESSFGGRSADAIRNMVCASLTVAPDFCQIKLNTTPAGTSFSLSYTGSGSLAVANDNCGPTI